jgi:hypothetical protein
MVEIRNRSVVVSVPDDVDIPAEAGKMSSKEVLRLGKGRRGIAEACTQAAEAMRANPERFCPIGVTPESLETAGRSAAKAEGVRVDVQTVYTQVSQVEMILNGRAHDELRKVLAFIRSQQKFDPRIADLAPCVVEYFSRKPGKVQEPAADLPA